MQTVETNRVPVRAHMEDFQYPEFPYHGGSGFFPEAIVESDSSPALSHGWSDRLPSEKDTAQATVPADNESTESFQYPVVSASAAQLGAGAYGPIAELAAEIGYPGLSSRAEDPRNESCLKQLLSDETRKAEQRGHILGFDQGMMRGREEGLERGMQQGREQARVHFLEEGSKQIAEERSRLIAQGASLIESFASTKDYYLHHLEEEAVQLALAISARIMRREAEADPLLLTGSVRVALGQLSASTKVRLVVPALDQPLWQEALARMPGLPIRPEVAADSQMGLGECRMETELGTADLGLWSQLKTIEKCFFERPGRNLLESEPPATTASLPAQQNTSLAEAGYDEH